MNVTLRQLQAFTGVYRTRSITRAARELGITQSAASLLIQQLEAQLGVKLFDRSTRSVQPTLAADEAVHAAERMLGDALGLSRRMRDLAQARAGRVAFLASAGTASALLPSVLAKFRAGYPDIEIDMRDVAADDLVPRLSATDAEFAIGSVEGEFAELTIETLTRGRLSAIGRRTADFAARRSLTWDELAQMPTIAMRRETRIRMQIDQALGTQAGVTVGTFIKVLMDHGVSASKVQTVFSDRVDAAEDFDYGEDDDDDSWLEGGPARMPKAKTHRTKGGVGYQFASDIHPEEIKWLWPNRIARGKLSFLAGPADQGKSQMICDITARVTNGQAWPNNEGKIAEADRGSVIVLSSEDDPADTMVPRLMAAGADLTRVIFVKMMVTPIEGKAGRMFNIAQDLAQLTEIIRARDDVKLITIDPINAYMGTGGRNGTDTFKTSEVRAVLSPLGRMLDSQAFTAIARTGWFVAPEMKDKAETGLKFFVKGKSNVGAPMPGLTYRIEAVTVQTGNGLTLTVPRIKWEGTTDKSSAQAFRQMDNGGETEERGTLSDAAETFLRDELSPKPLDLKILRGRAEDAGHSWRNVRRVAAEIGVVSASDGFGKGRVTTWTLAEETDYL